jgi:cell division protease FtsH
MKISDSIETIHALSAREAISRRHGQIEPEHVMLCLLRMAQLARSDTGGLKGEKNGLAALAEETRELRAEFERQNIDISRCREQLSELLGRGRIEYRGGGIHRSPACRLVFELGAALAQASQQVFLALHLLQAIIAQPTPMLSLVLSKRRTAGRALSPDEQIERSPDGEKSPAGEQPDRSGNDLGELARLTQCLRELKADLLSRIFGQDHAIEAFIDGLFNAEITGSTDSERRAPRALFVFAGPPGVGKTYLAEAGAAALARPFRRFDMSAFAGHHQGETLVGTSRNYQGAQPGLLTGFVEQHPDAMLLFDEIEKAHLSTIHYFLQVLDAGRLDDKYTGKEVSFRNTIIIFTTNVGRKLYDNPERSGVHTANSAFHRRTIVDALASEINPATQEPFFPEAICSRMATGYPVLFNHLGVNELTRVVQSEAERTAALLAKQLGKQIELDELLPLLLVMKEGGQVDARTLRAQTSVFIKNEIFKMARLFSDKRLEDALAEIDTICFELDAGKAELAPAIAALLQPPARPRLLLVGSSPLGSLLATAVKEIDWCQASTQESALAALAEDPPDFALIDLWMDGNRSAFQDSKNTIGQFDLTPPAARELERGQELLRKMHERAPGFSVLLLLMTDAEGKSVDEELLSACIRAGGARGALQCRINAAGLDCAIDEFRANLLKCAHRLAREKGADLFARQHKALNFDTAPHLDRENRVLKIRMRNLRLVRAVRAADAGEILEEVERPQDRFADVIGADSAKEELHFFIDYLKNPRRFTALGLKPPRGILLYGPPGTGKTMLARALAGESEVAFLPSTASSFVTKWQGSGPESVRQLFARARRYAPAIVFIDEIDAIGRMRTGGPSGHGEEMALNALLTEMDGFSEQQSNRPVFVLAATNFRVDAEESNSGASGRALDPALVRRFSRTILVDLPDTAARRRYFAMRLARNEAAQVSEQALDLLAEKSVGMSIANLEQVLEAAGRAAFRTGAPLNDDILIEALDTVREGEAKEWTAELLEGTAWHEAGHTIMYWLGGHWSPEVSIVARADHGGGMRRAVEEFKQESRTRSELLAQIRVSLGGRVAEMIHFGEESGLSTGASGDLDFASGIARQMICAYGMDEVFGPGSMRDMLNRPEALGTPLYREIQQRVAAIMKEQLELTRESLTSHHDRLAALARELLKKNRLLRGDLEAILGPPPNKN